MASKRYQYDAAADRRGRTLSAVSEDGTRTPVLHLPDGLPSEVYSDVWQLAGRVYEDGRHDRGAEMHDAPPPAAREPHGQDLGAAWDGGALMAGAVLGHKPGSGEHVHVQRIRFTHSHDGGAAEHGHPHGDGS